MSQLQERKLYWVDKKHLCRHYLVDKEGEVVAEVKQLIDLFFWGERSFISEQAAKSAVENHYDSLDRN